MKQQYWMLRAAQAGFTLLELLVVITIVAILAGLLLPTLAKAKSKAGEIHCLNNKKQMQLIWQLYETDHDRMPPNGENPIIAGTSTLPWWWAQGILDYDGNNPDNTNTALLLDPQYARLGLYAGSAGIYRCPGDRSSIRANGASISRVRSISLNAHLGKYRNCDDVYAEPFGPQRVSDLPNPAGTFAFIDHHPDSLSFIQFEVNPARGAATVIESYPGSFHQKGATLSFVDGHAEIQRWRDPLTLIPVRHERGASWPPTQKRSPSNPDIHWLQERTVFPESE